MQLVLVSVFEFSVLGVPTESSVPTETSFAQSAPALETSAKRRPLKKRPLRPFQGPEANEPQNSADSGIQNSAAEKLPFTLRKMWNAIETDIRSGINWRQATQVYEKPANFEERMDRFQAGVLNGSNYVQAMLSAIKAEPLQEFVELESEVRNGGDWKQKYKWETQSDLGRKALTWHVDLLKKGLSSEEAKAFTILWGYLKLPRVTSSVSSQNPTAAPPTPTFLATPGLSNK